MRTESRTNSNQPATPRLRPCKLLLQHVFERQLRICLDLLIEYREGRRKEDFDSYMKENPAAQVVEMDTVEGPRTERRCLLTLLFLNCTLQLAFLRESNSSATTTHVWRQLRSRLTIDEVKRLFPIVLTDKGTEFTKPEEIEENEYGEILTSVFYCHPLASWEKGGLREQPCDDPKDPSKRIFLFEPYPGEGGSDDEPHQLLPKAAVQRKDSI